MAARRRLTEERRQQILDAAVSVISSRGVCDTRIADIAQKAGTSAALVLYYFGSKDELLTEALTYAEERFYATTATELAKLPSARDRMIRLIELSCEPDAMWTEGWVDEWVLWIDMWHRAPRDRHVAANREALDRRWRETIATVVRDGQAAGEFGPVDPEDFAVRFAAMLDGLSIQVVLKDPTMSPHRMMDVCIRMAQAELGFHRPPDGRKPARRRRAASKPTA